MTMHNRDSAEAQFMSLFSDLKLWSDDQPEDLPKQATSDSSIRDLCTRLYKVADVIRDLWGENPLPHFSQANPGFIKSWRDFEERYAVPLFKVALQNLASHDDKVTVPMTTWDMQWSSAELYGTHAYMALVRSVMSVELLGDEYAAKLNELFPAENCHVSATDAWSELVDKVGLDIQKAVRRRVLLPSTLISKKISSKEDTGDIVGLLQSLEEAQRAFVFGATSAAFGMLRSVLEALLRDHYGAKGETLSKMLDTTHLRAGPVKDNIYRLKKTANIFLHNDREGRSGDLRFTYERLKKMSEKELEQEFVSLFLVLRSLIERAT